MGTSRGVWRNKGIKIKQLQSSYGDSHSFWFKKEWGLRLQGRSKLLEGRQNVCGNLATSFLGKFAFVPTLPKRLNC